jgi:hypothetical protein
LIEWGNLTNYNLLSHEFQELRRRFIGIAVVKPQQYQKILEANGKGEMNLRRRMHRLGKYQENKMY